MTATQEETCHERPIYEMCYHSILLNYCVYNKSTYYVSAMVYSRSPFSRALHFFNTITQLLHSRYWLCSISEYEITY
jgi:hypothetical protein